MKFKIMLLDAEGTIRGMYRRATDVHTIDNGRVLKFKTEDGRDIGSNLWFVTEEEKEVG